MPSLKEMHDFTKELLAYLPEYEYIRQHIPSRAILLIKKSLKRKSWINFPKFFQMIKKILILNQNIMLLKA